MKKLLALLTACTMLLGVTANALPGYTTLETIDEVDFYNYNHMAKDPQIKMISALNSQNGDTTKFPNEISVIDGALIWGATDLSKSGSQYTMFKKVFATVTPADVDGGEPTITYNDKGTGKTVLSFSPYILNQNAGWQGDTTGTMRFIFYTGTEGNYKQLFYIRTGKRGCDMRVNGSSSAKLNTDTGYPKKNLNTPLNYSFTLDHDTETITLSLGDSRDSKSTPYTFTSKTLKDTPITKLEVTYGNGNGETAAIVVPVDDITVKNISTDGAVETPIYSEDFEDSTKKLARDFGIADGLNYVYRGDNYIGVVNDGTKGNILFEKNLKTFPTEGLVAIQFTLNAYNSKGTNTHWLGLDNSLPTFAIGYKSGTSYTLYAGISPYNNGAGGGREQASYVTFTGNSNKKAETNVPAGTQWDALNDFKVLLDMDTKTYNVYYKDTTGTYVQFNKESDIKLTEANSYTFNTIWFGADNVNSVCQYEISDLKIYTVEQDAPPVVYVAEVDGVGYETFAEALAAAEDGATLKLLEDVTLEEAIKIENDITLDLAGKKLTTFALNSNYDVTVKGNVVIDDTVGGGSVDVKGTYGIGVGTTAALTVNAGTFNHVAETSDYLIGSWGTTVINGGTFNGVYNAVNGFQGTVTINGGSFTSTIYEDEGCVVLGNTTVNGGTFSEDVSDYCANGFKAEANGDGTFGIVAFDAVAKVNEDLYETFAEAYEAAVAGDTITLLADVNANALLALDKAITLDLNNFAYTSTAAKAIEVYADATIKNGTVTGKDRAVDTRVAVTLNLENVTLNVTGTGNTQPLTVGGSENGTVINVTNSTITANKIGYGIITFVKSDINIVNTDISGYAALFFKDGSANSVATVDADSTLTAYSNPGYLFGAIVLEDDNITVTVDGAINADEVAEGATNAALVLNGNANTVALNGTVTADQIIDSYVDGATITTTNAAVAEALEAEGYVVAEENGVYGVTGEFVPSVMIGDKGYATFAEAYEAAVAGDTITLLADVNADAIFALDKAITLDLNNFAYTSTARKAIEVYADATIKNGTVTGSERAVNTRKAVTLNLENVTLNVTGTGNTQPLTVGGSENGTVINVTDSTITANKIGYGIITFVESDINIVNTDISGYAALYLKEGSANSVVTVDADSTLTGFAKADETFGVVVFEDNNVDVTIDGNITATNVAVAEKYSAVLSKDNAILNVALNGEVACDVVTFVVEDEVINLVDGSVITTTNATIAAALEAEGYVVAAPVDGVYAVTGVAKVLDVTATSVKVAGLDGACTLILATYANDQFVAIKAIPLTADVEMTLAEAGLNTAGADTVKAFLWNGLRTMVPVVGYTADSAAL